MALTLRGNGQVSSDNYGIDSDGSISIVAPTDIDKDEIRGLLRLTGRSSTENGTVSHVPSAGTAIEFYNKWTASGSGDAYSMGRIAARGEPGYEGGLHFDVSDANNGPGETNWRNVLYLTPEGHVGIGSSAPLSTASTTVTVGDHLNTSGLTSDMFLCGDQTGVEGDISRLFFKNSNQSGGSAAHIKALRTGSNYGTSLAFHVQTLGTPGDGTEQMRIHDNGCVTTPAQPAFRANASLAATYGVGWQKVIYNASFTSRGSGYNSSTAVFTAPVDGWYQFNAQWNATSNSDIDGTLSIWINGSAIDLAGSSSTSNTGPNYEAHVVSGACYLAANDYVSVHRYSSVSNTTRTGIAYGGWFSGFLIG